MDRFLSIFKSKKDKKTKNRTPNPKTETETKYETKDSKSHVFESARQSHSYAPSLFPPTVRQPLPPSPFFATFWLYSLSYLDLPSVISTLPLSTAFLSLFNDKTSSALFFSQFSFPFYLYFHKGISSFIKVFPPQRVKRIEFSGMYFMDYSYTGEHLNNYKGNEKEKKENTNISTTSATTIVPTIIPINKTPGNNNPKNTNIRNKTEQIDSHCDDENQISLIPPTLPHKEFVSNLLTSLTHITFCTPTIFPRSSMYYIPYIDHHKILSVVLDENMSADQGANIHGRREMEIRNMRNFLKKCQNLRTLEWRRQKNDIEEIIPFPHSAASFTALTSNSPSTSPLPLLSLFSPFLHLTSFLFHQRVDFSYYACPITPTYPYLHSLLISLPNAMETIDIRIEDMWYPTHDTYWWQRWKSERWADFRKKENVVTYEMEDEWLGEERDEVDVDESGQEVKREEKNDDDDVKMVERKRREGPCKYPHNILKEYFSQSEHSNEMIWESLRTLSLSFGYRRSKAMNYSQIKAIRHFMETIGKRLAPSSLSSTSSSSLLPSLHSLTLTIDISLIPLPQWRSLLHSLSSRVSFLSFLSLCDDFETSFVPYLCAGGNICRQYDGWHMTPSHLSHLGKYLFPSCSSSLSTLHLYGICLREKGDEAIVSSALSHFQGLKEFTMTIPKGGGYDSMGEVMMRGIGGIMRRGGIRKLKLGGFRWTREGMKVLVGEKMYGIHDGKESEASDGDSMGILQPSLPLESFILNDNIFPDDSIDLVNLFISLSKLPLLMEFQSQRTTFGLGISLDFKEILKFWTPIEKLSSASSSPLPSPMVEEKKSMSDYTTSATSKNGPVIPHRYFSSPSHFFPQMKLLTLSGKRVHAGPSTVLNMRKQKGHEWERVNDL